MLVSTPSEYQVIQRSGAAASIPITGTIPAGTHTLEGRFNGGSWTALAGYSLVGTAFTGTLASQAQGQGTLEIRCATHPAEFYNQHTVGIGDVFVIAGQSNAVGYGDNNQSYSNARYRATIFANNYQYKNATDPIDSAVGQVDLISEDGNAAFGSVWLPMATLFMADQSVPIMFIPCAKNGSNITQWQPGVNHQNRATLYGSMVYRALQQPNGIQAVLWWQGEADAVNGVSQASYEASLDILSNAIFADLGVKLIPAKLQNCQAISPGNQAAINAAIAAKWGTGNVLTGPDLSGLITDDEYHLRTNGKLSSAAALWWAALQALFY
jgi:hypothetical protein